MTIWNYKRFKQNGESIKSYTDMASEGINSVEDISYFAGDFWPNEIENLIEEHEKKCKRRSKKLSANKNNLAEDNKILKKVQLYYKKYGKV